MTAEPLILTLALDERAQQVFDDLRTAHFPAERNHLRAHVTLFHHLPGDRLEEIVTTVRAAARRPGFEVAVTGVRLLGRGVAYDLASAELADLHARLVGAWSTAAWDGALTRQDRQPFRPHVTVANKIEPAAARTLAAELAAAFGASRVPARGLDLWWYQGGPWRHEQHLPFAG